MMFWIVMDKEPKRKGALTEAALLVFALVALIAILGIAVYSVAFP